MKRLSFELIEQIASYLDVGDAVALSATFRNAREACYSRIDPERYLQGTFQHARYLLAAMTDFGCVISGSRALEYFIPGSINQPPAGGYSADAPPSDWDFFVPCIERSTVGMLDALEKCGVEWENPAEVFELVNKPAGSGGTIYSRALDYHSRYHLQESTPEFIDLYTQLDQFRQSLDGQAWINVEVLRTRQAPAGGSAPPRHYKFTVAPPSSSDPPGPDVTSPYDDYDDDDDDDDDIIGVDNILRDQPIKMINGYIWARGENGTRYRQKVQLFQCHNYKRGASTPLEYVISTYYATHVQCFISGWSAGHFYYDLARERLALLWAIRQSYRYHRVLERCITKYRSRGYRFFDASKPNYEINGQLQRKWVDEYNLLEAPNAEYHDIVQNFNNACDNEDIRDAFLSAIGPAAVDMAMATDMAQRDAAIAAAVAIALAASSSLLASIGVYNPNNHRRRPPGFISREAYEALHAAGKPKTFAPLRMKGALLLRFNKFQNDIWKLYDCGPDAHHYYGGSMARSLEMSLFREKVRIRYYDAFLSDSIRNFSFTVPPRGTGLYPVANEPELSKWLRGSYPQGSPFEAPPDGAELIPSLCVIMIRATASGVIVGSQAAPRAAVLQALPADAAERLGTDAKSQEEVQRKYRVLLRLTRKACPKAGAYCDSFVQKFLPPQI